MAAFFSGRRRPNEAEETEMTPVTQGDAVPIGFETVLGASAVLDGKLACSGNIRLDGTLRGTLEISGNVLVGETAEIHADIDAQNISVAGTVRGNVSGTRVQLLRTGRVWGDIKAAVLTTEEGAFIDGKISMQPPSSTSARADESPLMTPPPATSEPTTPEPREETAASGEDAPHD